MSTENSNTKQPCTVDSVVSTSDKKQINHKNSKYCTYKGECYQTIACRAGGKKLCTHFDLSVKQYYTQQINKVHFYALLSSAGVLTKQITR